MSLRSLKRMPEDWIQVVYSALSILTLLPHTDADPKKSVTGAFACKCTKLAD